MISDHIDAGTNFCVPTYDVDLIMIRLKEPPPPENKNKWTNWLVPFQPEMWLALLATVILSCFVYRLLEYL
jgi:hypothetical protein